MAWALEAVASTHDAALKVHPAHYHYDQRSPTRLTATLGDAQSDTPACKGAQWTVVLRGGHPVAFNTTYFASTRTLGRASLLLQINGRQS
ncbi:MAG: hypothetical protein ACREP9_08010 [Candidatus Dormibacteraceae bacterium]